jgi:hypothetical protein
MVGPAGNSAAGADVDQQRVQGNHPHLVSYFIKAFLLCHTIYCQAMFSLQK